jgi:hypothetical protein
MSIFNILIELSRFLKWYCGTFAQSKSCGARKQLFLGNDSANTSVARQWFSSCHVIAVRDPHATMVECSEAVFSREVSTEVI